MADFILEKEEEESLIKHFLSLKIYDEKAGVQGSKSEAKTPRLGRLRLEKIFLLRLGRLRLKKISLLRLG